MSNDKQLNKKTPYPYNDTTMFEMLEEGDIHFRVISNEKGMFVDIRKFLFGKPSQKGIRVSVDSFERMYKAYMKSDYDQLKDEDIKDINKEIEKEKENDTPNPTSTSIKSHATLTTIKKKK